MPSDASSTAAPAAPAGHHLQPSHFLSQALEKWYGYLQMHRSHGRLSHAPGRATLPAGIQNDGTINSTVLRLSILFKETKKND
jgi:hypothetical protein